MLIEAPFNETTGEIRILRPLRELRRGLSAPGCWNRGRSHRSLRPLRGRLIGLELQEAQDLMWRQVGLFRDRDIVKATDGSE